MTELSLHILDIVHNSLFAKASLISILIVESRENNLIRINIKDDGLGMDPDIKKKVTDPFYTTRTTRKVGMGLPLFKQAVELCSGNFKIDSELGKGTIIEVDMPLDHIDRQPLGDIAGVIAQLVGSFPEVDFVYNHQTEAGVYNFDTRQVKATLDDIPINDLNVIQFIREMIRENLKEINISD
jgi:hypothetical protein